MRKKGILVTIGIVLALLVYIGIGVTYFYPQLAEQKRIESKEEPLPKAKVEEEVAPPVKVEVVTPEKEPPKVVTPVEVKVEEPVVIAEEVTPPAPVEVKEPPVVVEEKLPEVEVIIPAPVEVVAEEPLVEVKPRVFERIQPTVEIEWTPSRAVPPYEMVETALETVLPHFTPRVVVPEAVAVEAEVEIEVVEVKAPRVYERVQPTVDLIPVEKHPEPTLYRAEVLEPLFKAPQPVELFWDPPQVAEESQYLSLPTFLAEAHKARQEAVDAIFDKLIWP
jgi:hypothetical protein